MGKYSYDIEVIHLSWRDIMSRISSFGGSNENDYLAAVKKLAVLLLFASTNVYAGSGESVKRFQHDLLFLRDDVMRLQRHYGKSFKEIDTPLSRLYSQSRAFLTCDENDARSVRAHLRWLGDKAWPVLRSLRNIQPDPPLPRNVIMFRRKNRGSF
jgi:hypothetical protein